MGVGVRVGVGIVQERGASERGLVRCGAGAVPALARRRARAPSTLSSLRHDISSLRPSGLWGKVGGRGVWLGGVRGREAKFG